MSLTALPELTHQERRLKRFKEQRKLHNERMATSAEYRAKQAAKVKRRETVLASRIKADAAERLDRDLESALRTEENRRAYLLVRGTTKQTIKQWIVGTTGHHPELADLSRVVNELLTGGPDWDDYQLEVQGWILSTDPDVPDSAPAGPDWCQRITALMNTQLTVPEHIEWIEAFDY